MSGAKKSTSLVPILAGVTALVTITVIVSLLVYFFVIKPGKESSVSDPVSNDQDTTDADNAAIAKAIADQEAADQKKIDDALAQKEIDDAEWEASHYFLPDGYTTLFPDPCALGESQYKCPGNHNDLGDYSLIHHIKRPTEAPLRTFEDVSIETCAGHCTDDREGCELFSYNQNKQCLLFPRADYDINADFSAETGTKFETYKRSANRPTLDPTALARFTLRKPNAVLRSSVDMPHRVIDNISSPSNCATECDGETDFGCISFNYDPEHKQCRIMEGKFGDPGATIEPSMTSGIGDYYQLTSTFTEALQNPTPTSTTRLFDDNDQVWVQATQCGNIHQNYLGAVSVDATNPDRIVVGDDTVTMVLHHGSAANLYKIYSPRVKNFIGIRSTGLFRFTAKATAPEWLLEKDDTGLYRLSVSITDTALSYKRYYLRASCTIIISTTKPNYDLKITRYVAPVAVTNDPEPVSTDTWSVPDGSYWVSEASGSCFAAIGSVARMTPWWSSAGTGSMRAIDVGLGVSIDRDTRGGTNMYTLKRGGKVLSVSGGVMSPVTVQFPGSASWNGQYNFNWKLERTAGGVLISTSESGSKTYLVLSGCGYTLSSTPYHWDVRPVKNYARPYYDFVSTVVPL